MSCLRNLLAGVGCLVVLVALAALAFVFRGRLDHFYRHLRGLPERAPVVYVQPSAGGAAHAEAALRDLARGGGPAYVDISPGDLAALLDRELARLPRRVFDSLTVALDSPRVLVKGTLDVSALPQRLLGPLGEGLGRYEPVAAGGPLAAGADGRLRWTVDQLTIRDFPFPRSVIPALIRSFAMTRAADAAVPIPLAAPVGDVRVSAAGVRLYRAASR